MTSYQLKTQTIYCGDNIKMLKDLPEIKLCFNMYNKFCLLIIIIFFHVNNVQSQDKQVDCDLLISCLNDKMVEYGGWFLDLKDGTIIDTKDNLRAEVKTNYYKQFLKGSFSGKDKSEYLLFLTFMSDEFMHVGNYGTCIAFLLDDKFKQIKGPVDLIYRVFTVHDGIYGETIKEPTKIDINNDGIEEFYFEDVYGQQGHLMKHVNIYYGNLEKLIRYEIYYSDKETLKNKYIKYNSFYKFADSKVIFNSTVEKYLIISEDENRLAFKGEYLDEYIFKDGDLKHIYDKRNINFNDFEME